MGNILTRKKKNKDKDDGDNNEPRIKFGRKIVPVEKSKSESNSHPKSNPKSDPKSEPKSDPKSDPKSEPKSKPESELKLETISEPESMDHKQTESSTYSDVFFPANSNSDPNFDVDQNGGELPIKDEDESEEIKKTKKSKKSKKSNKRQRKEIDQALEEVPKDTSPKLRYRDIVANSEHNGYKSVITIDFAVDTPEGSDSYHLEVDEDKFVKMTIDYLLVNRLNDASYLIGYKMVYMVDSKRRKIPGVIAIVTLRIPRHENSIYQSEGNHVQKDVYKMIEFAQKEGPNKYYDRDSQAKSLKSGSFISRLARSENIDGNGDMIAWEHSTKYCAYRVETLGITILGRLKNVVVASHLYNQNLACAESAFTFEENMEPVVYEVGVTNVSKHERPQAGIGNCLDFFHFFLNPQYAIDYGFYNFLMEENQNAIDLKTITASKRFDSLRKVSYFKEIKGAMDFVNDDQRVRDRATAKFVNTDHGYRTQQYVINDEKNRSIIDEETEKIDAELEEELQDLENDMMDIDLENDMIDEKLENDTIVQDSIDLPDVPTHSAESLNLPDVPTHSIESDILFDGSAEQSSSPYSYPNKKVVSFAN